MRWPGKISARRPDIVLCGDDDLRYRAGRTRFVPGEGFALDEAYRLAHLPLVAPGHPRLIARKDGTFYDNGRHDRVVSLVLPVPGALLSESESYRELEDELKASPFAGKIAWDIVERRRDRLHATIHGQPLPAIDTAHRAALARLGPLTVELRGLFSGTVNHGRLYLRAYPQKIEGRDGLREVQRVLGGRESGLYLVGLYNLPDDLDPHEAAALSALIDRWWDRPILRWQADRLWLLGARDDLVLDCDIVEAIPLC